MLLNDHYFLNPAHLELARARYFRKDENGEVVENDIGEVFERVVDYIYQDDLEHKEEALRLRNEKKLVDAGRPLAQAGTQVTNMFNCFVLGFDDDTREAISDLKRKHFNIQALGGGTGMNFSVLRPNGSICKTTQSRSSGAVGFVTDISYQSSNVCQPGNRCLPGDVRVAMADGSWRNIIDIRKGDVVLAYDHKSGKPVKSQVLDFYENGYKEVKQYKLFNGYTVRCTPDHRWVTCTTNVNKDYMIRSLDSAPKSGKGVGIAKYVDVFGDATSKWFNIMGYLLGDGCFMGDTVKLSNISAPIMKKFKELLPLECNTWGSGGDLYFSSDGEFQCFLRDVGLYQTRSYEKFIPDAIFKANKTHIIHVINGLFATDGWVNDSTFGFCSTSERLVRDLRLLLWKFGIHGSIGKNNRKGMNSNGKKYRELWSIEIKHPDSYNKCIKLFDVPGKTNGKVIKEGCIQHRRRNDIYFHKVKEEVSIGKDLTFCIKIDHPDHLFITEFGISHNSGANMGLLEDWHPDLYEFITKKSESNWENIRKFATIYSEDEFAYFQWKNPHPWQMFNVSVGVSNELMDSVINDPGKEWILNWKGHPWHLWEFKNSVGPASKGEYNKTFVVVAASEEMAWYKASSNIPYFNKENLELVRGPYNLTAIEWFKMICKNAWDDGCPGILFMDQSKKFHNGEYFNPIAACNPCAEQMLPKNGVCDLASLILPSFFDTIRGVFDWDEFRRAIRQAVRGLDNIISLNKTGEKDIDENSVAERRVGLGTTGIAELLILMKLKYSSDEGRQFVEKVLTFLRDEAYNTSIDLAIEKGPFPNFDYDGFSRSAFFATLPQEIKSRIKRYGIRNVTVLTQAPTGTTGTMVGYATGCEPYFAMCFNRNSRVGVFLDGSPAFLKWLKDNNIDYKDYDYDLDKLRKNMSVPEYFEEAHKIHWKDHIRMQAVFAKYIDSSVSKTINLPNSATVEDVTEAYLMAYKLGIKSTTVYRDGSKEQILEKIIKSSSKSRPSDIIKAHAPKRPEKLECDIYHTSVKGDKWTVLVGLLDDVPYEVFCAPQDNFEIAKKYKKGVLVKNGRGSYYLETEDFILKNISSYLKTDEHRVITRLLSTCLRHGVPMSFIADQLAKADGTVVDFSKAVARVLKKYNDILGSTGKESLCQFCGGNNVVLNGGCPSCLDCGKSKCD